MAANEELSNLLNGPLSEDFWSMDVDGGYHGDAQWLQQPRELRPPYEMKKPQQSSPFADGPTTPSFSTSDLFALTDSSLVEQSQNYHQNFLSESILESVPESMAVSEAPMMRLDGGRVKSVSQLPYQRTYNRDVDFETRPLSTRESESTNSSLETTFQLTDHFLSQEGNGSICGMPPIRASSLLMTSSVISSQLDLKPVEMPLFAVPRKDVKVESGSLPTMMAFPPRTLPRMIPPVLPKLFTSGSNLLLSPSQLAGSSAWDMNPLERVLGRSLSEPKREERPPRHKSHSVPTVSCTSRSTQSCTVLSSTDFSLVSKCPKKPYVGKLSPAERQLKIMRYRQKRNMRKFDRGVTYQCRKTLADRRPRVRGRFARNNDIHATFPKSKEPPQDESETSQRTSLDRVRGS